MLCNFYVILNGALVCALAVLSYKYSVLYHQSVAVKPSESPPKGHQPEPSKSVLDGESERSVLQTGSSVWCRGENINRRLCRFRNLCIDSLKQEFIFLHGPETIISGLERTNQKQPAADLSSVENHNVLQLILTDVPVERVTEFYKLNVINESSLLFYRFKPDNLMHIFHDDLLPLFQTYLELCGGSLVHCPQNIQLAFIDPWPEGPHPQLYGIFTHLPQLMLPKPREPVLTCFKDAYVGVSRMTLWYQYGFVSPQGPILNRTVSSLEIRRFTDYFVNQFPEIIPRSCDEKSVAVLLTRKNTRLILNEDEVARAMSEESGLHVVVLSLDDHSLADLVGHVQCADLLVGMHGALLVLAMFLKPGSAFIELFPYAVPPDDYTPYKTLVNLPGMGVVYRAWVNEKHENTVTHPDWPPELGGIRHLSAPEQRDIEDISFVNPHLCCDNPGWLFRIYQDTKVDEVSFRQTLREVLAETLKFSGDEHEKAIHSLRFDRVFPGKVEELLCDSMDNDPGLKLSWRPPNNLRALPEDRSVAYEVWTQLTNSQNGEYKMIVTNETTRVLRAIEAGSYVNIWVRCRIDDDKLGPFSWVGCFAKDIQPPGISY